MRYLIWSKGLASDEFNNITLDFERQFNGISKIVRDVRAIHYHGGDEMSKNQIDTLRNI